jgi:hypothetical protein
MDRLFFALLIMNVGALTVLAMGDEVQEPTSVRALEGKTLYVPISPAVNSIDESKIQKDDQNITKHGQAK